MSFHRRILMLSYPFPPARSGGVFRTVRFVRYLPEFGWEPIVVTPGVESVAPISVDTSLERLVPEGLRVERTRVFRPLVRIKGGLKTAARGFRQQPAEDHSKHSASDLERDRDGSNQPPAARRFSRLRGGVRRLEQLCATPDRHVGWFLPAVMRGLKVVRRDRPRVIYSTGPPHSTHLIAVALKRLTGLPVVLDFRDPWADREWSGLNRRSFRSRMAGRLEALCVRSADRVLLNTDAVRDLFISKYGQSEPTKFSALPNGFEPSLARDVRQLLERYAAEGANGCVKLCHAGSIWGRRDLRPLVEAVRIAGETGCHVELEQVGAVDPHLCPSNGFDENYPTLRCLGELPHEQALERMARANVLVLIQPENTLQIPGKIYEMLLFGKPILALTGKGATGELVEKFGMGHVAAPDDPRAIAAAICHVVNDDLRRQQRRSVSFEQALCEFDGRNLTQKLAHVFDSITRQ